jgi:hypothetical protein
MLNLEEGHDKISLSSLSKTLVGLSHQALSYRRESNERDYLHPYFRDRATQGEIKDPNNEFHAISHMWENYTVQMERDYLKAWDIFDREVDGIWPRFKTLIESQKDDIEGQLFCLYGMSACKVQAPEVREKVYKNIKTLLSQKLEKEPRT